MSRELPEIVKQAERVLASIEDAASRFARLVQLRGALNRRINKRTRDEEHHRSA